MTPCYLFFFFFCTASGFEPTPSSLDGLLIPALYIFIYIYIYTCKTLDGCYNVAEAWTAKLILSSHLAQEVNTFALAKMIYFHQLLIRIRKESGISFVQNTVFPRHKIVSLQLGQLCSEGFRSSILDRVDHNQPLVTFSNS